MLLVYIRYIFNVYCARQSSQFGCNINKHVCMYVYMSKYSICYVSVSAVKINERGRNALR